MTISRPQFSGCGRFRNDVVHGPGGAQILLKDPSGNLIELFQPGARKSGA